MNYAVDYAPVSDSLVYAWEDGKEPRTIVIKSDKNPGRRQGAFGTGKTKAKTPRTARSMTKLEFIESLSGEDTIFTELGGQNDKFCLAAIGHGVTMLRLPTFVIHDEQKRQREEDGKEGASVESSAHILWRWAKERPETFHPFREVDYPYTRVRMLSRMYWTIQRNIRIAIANRLRHIQEDMVYLNVGDSKRLGVISESISALIETVPTGAPSEMEVDDSGEVKLRGFERMENRFKAELKSELEGLPLYRAVFEPIKGCGPGIAGFVIAAIMDIRRFPSFPKLKAFAGYHLIPDGRGGFMAPRAMRGQRANWDHKLQQAVYYFATCMDKQKPDHVWKRQLEARKLYEIGKLLVKRREEGKDIPEDMTVEKFAAMVIEIRSKVSGTGEFARMPEAYKGIPAIAHKRALRWLGQKFLQYVWNGWRDLEGLKDPDNQLFPSGQVSAPYLEADEPSGEEFDSMSDPEKLDKDMVASLE